MKILFDCSSLAYYGETTGRRAGLFYAALNLLNAMKESGADITLYCDFSQYFYIKNWDYLKEFKMFKESSPFRLFLGYINYKLSKKSVFLKKIITVLMRVYNNKLYAVNGANINEISKYDVYFSPFTPPSKDIEQSGIKCFRMIHDVIPIIEEGLDKTKKNWHYWYNRVYYTINSKDYYVTNSEYTRQDVLKYFPFVPESHIKTTLLGANDSFMPSNEPSPVDGKYVFSLCTLGKRKNLEFGIRNFFEFIKKNNIDDLKLVLGGSIWDKYKKELNSVLDKYDRSKVILAGYIDEKELAKYYSNALCFIYPSLYEGFGLPVLEAMQCGCPVITSNTSSLPEVVGDSGIQVNPESDEDMVAAYEKMYFDSGFREECIRKGLERAKQFSWNKCAHEILEFINNTLGV